MKLRHKLLLYILAGALLIVALAVLVYIVDASESHAIPESASGIYTSLPLVLDTGGQIYEDPCPPPWQATVPPDSGGIGGGCLPPAVTPPPTPTWAPTVCPGYFETGVCDPTPTPFWVTVEP